MPAGGEVVELRLPDPGGAYTSASQRARVATEAWATAHLACPKCGATRLRELPRNTKVADYACADCGLRLQLKAKSGRFGASFTNSAYQPKIEAIRTRSLPDYALMSYDPLRWTITDLTILPGHFITEHAVVPRNPLRPTARRAGWVGSKVRIGDLPQDAFVRVVEHGIARAPRDVQRAYGKFAFLKSLRAESAGWMADVLKIVRDLAPAHGDEFALADVYARSSELQRLHPHNHHIEPKIRQQLQVLRDRGILEFVKRGHYRVARR